MEKYKICPHCGAHNNPVFMECAECGEDITSVRIVDSESENMGNAEPPAEPVRVCPECGAENPAAARKCMSCHEDISDVLPTEKGAEQKESDGGTTPEDGSGKYKLVSLDGDFEFALEGDAVVGRENAMSEYLAPKMYVSRRHMKIEQKDGRVFVTNLNATNYTFVNNVPVPGNARCEVKEGDEIGLGGAERNGARQDLAAYFILRSR